MLKVGLKDGRYFMVQVDLYESNGTDEAGTLITGLMEMPMFNHDQGIEALHDVLNQVIEVHAQKHNPQ